MCAVADKQLYVTSHVTRDLLQNAALFRTDRLVVWEYVSNGLQYVDPGTNPVVNVRMDSKNKRVTISDNGRGMDWEGLRNFFTMHGDNVDRREGRPGRGMFGTGKCAAFGIGDILRVTSIREGARCQVQLAREDILEMKDGDPIPVTVIDSGTPVSAPNGTVIDIEGVHLKSFDQAGVIRYIERHLARWPKGVTVFVNNHECEFVEPPIARQETVEPDEATRELLGSVHLTLKVAKAPLDEEARGVSIYSNGVWHETTLAGSEGREMAQYIFGEIDVPLLDEDKSPIPPFDLTRSMRLNPSNELVRKLMAFVGYHIDRIRRELCEAERQRRNTEEARRLAQEADKIAQVINDDFTEFRDKLARMRARAGGGLDQRSSLFRSDDGVEGLVSGSEVPAVPVEPDGLQGRDGTGHAGEEPNDVAPRLTKGGPEDRREGEAAKLQQKQGRPRGGFSVQFAHLGEEEARAKYVREERTIYVNLDHPLLSAALGQGTDQDPIFRRLSYEIAFAEYAIALTVEMNDAGEFMEPREPIFNVRDTLNRISRRGAALFAA